MSQPASCHASMSPPVALAAPAPPPPATESKTEFRSHRCRCGNRIADGRLERNALYCSLACRAEATAAIDGFRWPFLDFTS